MFRRDSCQMYDSDLRRTLLRNADNRFRIFFMQERTELYRGRAAKPGLPMTVEPAQPMGSRTAVCKVQVLILPAVLALGIFVGAAWAKYRPAISPERVVGVTRLAKPGPWGNLGFLPITIAAPVELLSVRNTE